VSQVFLSSLFLTYSVLMSLKSGMNYLSLAMSRGGYEAKTVITLDVLTLTGSVAIAKCLL
jgi:hypothetical protein